MPHNRTGSRAVFSEGKCSRGKHRLDTDSFARGNCLGPTVLPGPQGAIRRKRSPRPGAARGANPVAANAVSRTEWNQGGASGQVTRVTCKAPAGENQPGEKR